jgi:hypothetical protein
MSEIGEGRARRDAYKTNGPALQFRAWIIQGNSPAPLKIPIKVTLETKHVAKIVLGFKIIIGIFGGTYDLLCIKGMSSPQ